MKNINIKIKIKLVIHLLKHSNPYKMRKVDAKNLNLRSKTFKQEIQISLPRYFCIDIFAGGGSFFLQKIYVYILNSQF